MDRGPQGVLQSWPLCGPLWPTAPCCALSGPTGWPRCSGVRASGGQGPGPSQEGRKDAGPGCGQRLLEGGVSLGSGPPFLARPRCGQGQEAQRGLHPTVPSLARHPLAFPLWGRRSVPAGGSRGRCVPLPSARDSEACVEKPGVKMDWPVRELLPLHLREAPDPAQRGGSPAPSDCGVT